MRLYSSKDEVLLFEEDPIKWLSYFLRSMNSSRTEGSPPLRCEQCSSVPRYEKSFLDFAVSLILRFVLIWGHLLLPPRWSIGPLWRLCKIWTWKILSKSPDLFCFTLLNIFTINGRSCSLLLVFTINKWWLVSIQLLNIQFSEVIQSSRIINKQSINE